jgi:GR25 family glycosyltransferase involved in LPS biosynthesis
MFKELPNLYVAFQMEQSVSSRWFDKAYFTKLENSFAIFDYSSVNIEFLQKNGLSSRQIYYMPLSFLPDYMPQTINEDEQSYDVLFYGDIYNNRRRCFIDRLSARFSVNVINDLFGDELHAEMRKAKIVVNIHYYEGALLETTRIYECLSAGKLVVSEKSADQQEYTELDGIVDFVEIDDIDEMIKRVEFWLSDDRLRVEKIEDNRRLLTENPNLFVYYFMRFLLASENLDFDQFYKVAGPQITFDNDFICLGLPESIERRRDFEKDNHYGIEYFPALKHRLGWVGCGLSYKFIMKKALEQGLDTITVCEDDVEFFEGWSEQLEVIRKYLFSNMDEWDVFSGLIALLSDDVSVEKIEKLKNIEFIHIDRLISMVFNIYNNNVFKYIIDWDEQDHDANKNTIDKFLEKSSCVKVVTKLPFLVGHKNDLSSTLWGFKNEKYIDLIEKSSVRLAEKVELYKLNKSTDAVVEQKSASEIF